VREAQEPVPPQTSQACIPSTSSYRPITHAPILLAHGPQGARMPIPLPTLDALQSLTIPTPYTVPWGEMRGDDRSRLCGQCRRPVFDLSAMTAAEAMEYLASLDGRPCVRLYRRGGRSVLTADCPAACVHESGGGCASGPRGQHRFSPCCSCRLAA
jgi:hypothetical protein